MQSKITNTTKEENHPEWCRGGNPNAIERQEARGQKELVNSCSLPVKVNPPENKEKLKNIGIIFGQPYKDDPLFCDGILPNGWKKKATDHDMWTEIVNEKGIIKARIFYKAAFYDRSAFISLACT